MQPRIYLAQEGWFVYEAEMRIGGPKKETDQADQEIWWREQQNIGWGDWEVI